MSSAKDIDWDKVVKKEARGINDTDFGEVQLPIEDTVLTEKGSNFKSDGWK